MVVLGSQPKTSAVRDASIDRPRTAARDVAPQCVQETTATLRAEPSARTLLPSSRPVMPAPAPRAIDSGSAAGGIVSADLCEQAQLLPVPSQAIGSTLEATVDGAPFCFVSNDGPGVWYRVLGTGNTMIASTCSEFNSNPDTKISVYCAGCSNLNCVAGNDDNCTGYLQLLSTVSWCSERGTEYLILVHDYAASSGGGNFTLNVWDNGATCDTAVSCTSLRGACCDDSTRICQDRVSSVDCQPPNRFTADTSCAALDPPCGGPVGACCRAGACTDETESDCVGQSGVWFADASCANFTCPTPPTCPGNTLYGQLPNDPLELWSFGVSDTDWSGGITQRFESFAALNGPICDLHWWGLSYGSSGECLENPTTFIIKFYQSALGAHVPGSEVCSYTATLNGNPTGWPYAVGELLEYHVDFPTCCAISDGWVSIQATGGPDCWFWWLSSSGGDGTSCFQNDANMECSGTTIDSSYDLSFCLTGATAPLGACCVDSTCIGLMTEQMCLGQAGVWYPGENCDTVRCPEACCYPDGQCRDVPSPYCLETGGVPRGAGSSCATVRCEPIPCEQSPYPSCGGACPPDMVCRSSALAGICFCAPLPCEHTASPACGGVCPPGSVCEAVSLSDACACARLGVCCVNGDCIDGQTQRDCERQQGRWFPDAACANFFCPEACCFRDGTCTDVPPHVCLEQGGRPQGPGSDCANTDCVPPAVEHDFFADTTALVSLVGGPLGAQPTVFVLRGPLEVDVFFEGPNEGDALDDDGDSRDEVDTEMISMDLAGGGVTLTLNPARPSLGEIEERVNNNAGLLDLDPFAPGNADSFFDVFFDITISGVTVHNETPLRMAAVIDYKPPLARYFHLLPPGTPPIELCDPNGNPTGVFLVRGEHYTGHIEVDSYPGSWMELALIDPTGGQDQIHLGGPSAMTVYFESGEGQARDDSGDGRDEVQTELVGMHLTGESSHGPIRVSTRLDRPSAGIMEEIGNAAQGRLEVPPFEPGTVDSFFDVFFEIEIGGRVLVHGAPVRIAGILSHKPAALGNVYVRTDRSNVSLIDAGTGDPSGYFLGPIRYWPRPAGACCVDGTCIKPGTEAECVELGGTWFPERTCAEVVCPEACCFPDSTCADLPRDLCAERGGNPMGPGSQCADVVCEPIRCEQSPYPICGGVCPPDTACTPNEFTGQCICEPIPCEQSRYPACGGACPRDMVCTTDPTGADACVCVSIPVPCGLSPYPACGGECPPGEVCTPNDFGGACTCEPIRCEQSPHPTCGGECPPDMACVPSPIAGVCTCEPIGCEQSSYPACGGACPPDMVCTTDPTGLAACTCMPTLCEQSLFPTCGGDCPPGTRCEPDQITDRCVCLPVPCEQSFPACGGECPARMTCVPDPDSAAGCSCDPLGACCLERGPAIVCEMLTATECRQFQGRYAGDGTVCRDGTCECPDILESRPPNCAIDARYPYLPGADPTDVSNRIGFKSVELMLSPWAEMGFINPSSFQMSFVGPPVLNPPVPIATTLMAGTRVRVDFDKPIPVDRWSCMAMACKPFGFKEVCWGHHPADVDGNLVSNAPDVLVIIDYLNGIMPLDWYQCDVDASGVCNPADILGVIDLLNGASNFEVWNNRANAGGRCPTGP